MSERDDLFGDDSPEEKKSPKGREGEDFFFDVDEEDLQNTETTEMASPDHEEEVFISEEEFPPVTDAQDFSADEMQAEAAPVAGTDKNGSRSKTLLLLLLVILLLGAGYFYMGDMLFTPDPTPVKQVVKSQPQKMKVPERKETKKEQAAVKEVVMPAEKVSAAPAEKPAEPKVPAAPAMAKKDLPAPEKKPAVNTEKPKPVATTKPAAPAPVEKQPMPAAAPPSAPYTLQIGAFVLESNLAEALQTVKSLGYQPSIIEGTKTAIMTRLKVGSYPPEAAREKLKEIQQLVPSAFVLREGEQLTVYAGSYYLIDRARVQADRLFQHSVRVEEVKADVSVPIKTIRFGAFDTPASAKEAVEQAKQAGLETLVIKQN